MDHHDNLIATGQPHGRGGRTIVDPFVGEHLYFQVVVAGSQGAELVDAAFDGVVRHMGGVCALQTTAFLDAFEVLLPAISFGDAPAGSLPHNVAKVMPGKIHEAARSDTGRDAPEEFRHQQFQFRLHLGERQVGTDQPHPAVDIVADAAG